MTIRKDIYERHVHSIPEGKIIFSEGDLGEEMYIVIDGEVEISKRTGLETAKTLIILKNGDIFGEMALIEKKPRSATAIALKQTRLMSLDESLFFNMIAKNSDFAVKVVRILSERIRRSNMVIQQLTGTSKDMEVFQGLGEFAGKSGTQSVKGLRVNKNQFILWATSHIGMNDRDLNDGLKALIAKGTILQGANVNEIVIPPARTIQKLDAYR